MQYGCVYYYIFNYVCRIFRCFPEQQAVILFRRKRQLLLFLRSQPRQERKQDKIFLARLQWQRLIRVFNPPVALHAELNDLLRHMQLNKSAIESTKTTMHIDAVVSLTALVKGF